MSQKNIIAEVVRLTGVDFIPNRVQAAQLAAPQSAIAEIIKGLPLQIADLRKEVSDAVDGLDPEDIEPKDITQLLVLDRFVSGFTSNAQNFMIKRLAPLTVYEIGMRKGRATAGPINEIASLYVEVFGRAFDTDGFAFWSQKLREGVTLPTIRDAFIAAKAAGAT
ncbi:MAG: hypothetical protein ABJL67_09600 [Sulfitobacter sp.]